MRSGFSFKVLFLCILLVLLCVLALAIGPLRLSAGEILATLRGDGSDQAATVEWQIRLPRIAAALMEGVLGSTHLTAGERNQAEDFRDTFAEAGHDPADAQIAAGYAWLHVAKDPEKRWKEAVEHLAYQQNEYGKWFKAAGMDFIKPVEATRASIEENECYIVSPEQAVEMIEKYVDATTCERFYTWAVPPGLHPSWSDEHIELMAKEVIPNFR